MHTYIINDTKRDPELAENRRKVENPAAGLVPVLGGVKQGTGPMLDWTGPIPGPQPGLATYWTMSFLMQSISGGWFLAPRFLSFPL